MSTRILITGANGFLGCHLVKEGLDAGYTVRGTVRSAAKAEEMKKLFPKFEAAIVPDLITGDYTEAMKDVNVLIHAASPFALDVKDAKKDFMDPAIEGTTAVLTAAHKAGIKRVLYTSTVGAVTSKYPELLFADVTYTKEDWLPFTYDMACSPGFPAFGTYLASKKFAELAAWDFAKAHSDIKLTVLNPTLIYGPVIHPVASLESLNTSNMAIYALLNGKIVDDTVPVFCDVVSVAKLHIKALASDNTIGKRVLFAKGPGTMYQILEILHKKRPELASRLPALPAGGDPCAGKTISRIDNTDSLALGIEGLSLEETVLQTTDSILALEKKFKK